MRVMWACVLMGCSSPSAVTPPRDAGSEESQSDADVPEDAGTDAIACVPSDSCSPQETKSCAGGFVYGCVLGTCPTTAGGCHVIEDSFGNGTQGFACCTENVCTRSKQPEDHLCEKYDAGGPVGYACPKNIKPPGKCRGLYEPGPSQSFCCED